MYADLAHLVDSLGLDEMPNMAILARSPPYATISMPQDDSKQWEHLLSQENDPS